MDSDSRLDWERSDDSTPPPPNPPPHHHDLHTHHRCKFPALKQAGSKHGSGPFPVSAPLIPRLSDQTSGASVKSRSAAVVYCGPEQTDTSGIEGGFLPDGNISRTSRV